MVRQKSCTSLLGHQPWANVTNRFFVEFQFVEIQIEIQLKFFAFFLLRSGRTLTDPQELARSRHYDGKPGNQLTDFPD